MSRQDIVVPDLGGFDDVPIIDVLVKPGDVIEVDTPLITLETDKASMDVPSTAAGKVAEVTVKRGDKVSKGTVIARVEADGAGAGASDAPASGAGAARADSAGSGSGAASSRPAARPESSGDTVRMPAPDVSARAKADAASGNASSARGRGAASGSAVSAGSGTAAPGNAGAPGNGVRSDKGHGFVEAGGNGRQGGTGHWLRLAVF